MYTDFYGLTGRPFQLAPNPSFFYAGRAHRRAVAYLTFGLQQGEGFVVITGEIGAGKTTLVAYLEEQLAHQRLFVARINAVSLDAKEVLKLVARALELHPDQASTATLLGMIERDLRERYADRQRVLLVVDEAQNLGLEALEALRILSNLGQDDRALVQVLLLGQPQFRDTLARPSLEQLRQRVVASAHLGPLEADEVEPYLEHRLRRVGWRGTPGFEPGLFAEVFAFSRGLPRRINLLASRLLVHGAIEERETLTTADARELAHELEKEHSAPTLSPLAAAGASRPLNFGAAGPGEGAGADDAAADDLEPSLAPAPAREPSPPAAAAAVPARRAVRRVVEPKAARPVAPAPGGDVGAAPEPADVGRLLERLDGAYEELGRERDRFEGAREEIERLRAELHRIEVERLKVDAETTRRLAAILARANVAREGGDGGGEPGPD